MKSRGIEFRDLQNLQQTLLSYLPAKSICLNIFENSGELRNLIPANLIPLSHVASRSVLVPFERYGCPKKAPKKVNIFSKCICVETK